METNWQGAIQSILERTKSNLQEKKPHVSPYYVQQSQHSPTTASSSFSPLQFQQPSTYMSAAPLPTATTSPSQHLPPHLPPPNYYDIEFLRVQIDQQQKESKKFRDDMEFEFQSRVGYLNEKHKQLQEKLQLEIENNYIKELQLIKDFESKIVQRFPQDIERNRKDLERQSKRFEDFYRDEFLDFAQRFDKALETMRLDQERNDSLIKGIEYRLQSQFELLEQKLMNEKERSFEQERSIKEEISQFKVEYFEKIKQQEQNTSHYIFEKYKQIHQDLTDILSRKLQQEEEKWSLKFDNFSQSNNIQIDLRFTKLDQDWEAKWKSLYAQFSNDQHTKIVQLKEYIQDQILDLESKVKEFYVQKSNFEHWKDTQYQSDSQILQNNLQAKFTILDQLFKTKVSELEVKFLNDIKEMEPLFNQKMNTLKAEQSEVIDKLFKQLGNSTESSLQDKIKTAQLKLAEEWTQRFVQFQTTLKSQQLTEFDTLKIAVKQESMDNFLSLKRENMKDLELWQNKFKQETSEQFATLKRETSKQLEQDVSKLEASSMDQLAIYKKETTRQIDQVQQASKLELESNLQKLSEKLDQDSTSLSKQVNDRLSDFQSTIQMQKNTMNSQYEQFSNEVLSQWNTFKKTSSEQLEKLLKQYITDSLQTKLVSLQSDLNQTISQQLAEFEKNTNNSIKRSMIPLQDLIDAIDADMKKLRIDTKGNENKTGTVENNLNALIASFTDLAKQFDENVSMLNVLRENLTSIGKQQIEMKLQMVHLQDRETSSAPNTSTTSKFTAQDDEEYRAFVQRQQELRDSRNLSTSTAGITPNTSKLDASKSSSISTFSETKKPEQGAKSPAVEVPNNQDSIKQGDKSPAVALPKSAGISTNLTATVQPAPQEISVPIPKPEASSSTLNNTSTKPAENVLEDEGNFSESIAEEVELDNSSLDQSQEHTSTIQQPVESVSQNIVEGKQQQLKYDEVEHEPDTDGSDSQNSPSSQLLGKTISTIDGIDEQSHSEGEVHEFTNPLTPEGAQSIDDAEEQGKHEDQSDEHHTESPETVDAYKDVKQQEPKDAIDDLLDGLEEDFDESFEHSNEEAINSTIESSPVKPPVSQSAQSPSHQLAESNQLPSAYEETVAKDEQEVDEAKEEDMIAEFKASMLSAEVPHAEESVPANKESNPMYNSWDDDTLLNPLPEDEEEPEPEQQFAAEIDKEEPVHEEAVHNVEEQNKSLESPPDELQHHNEKPEEKTFHIDEQTPMPNIDKSLEFDAGLGEGITDEDVLDGLDESLGGLDFEREPATEYVKPKVVIPKLPIPPNPEVDEYPSTSLLDALTYRPSPSSVDSGEGNEFDENEHELTEDEIVNSTLSSAGMHEDYLTDPAVLPEVPVEPVVEQHATEETHDHGQQETEERMQHEPDEPNMHEPATEEQTNQYTYHEEEHPQNAEDVLGPEIEFNDDDDINNMISEINDMDMPGMDNEPLAAEEPVYPEESSTNQSGAPANALVQQPPPYHDPEPEQHQDEIEEDIHNSLEQSHQQSSTLTDEHHEDEEPEEKDTEDDEKQEAPKPGGAKKALMSLLNKASEEFDEDDDEEMEDGELDDLINNLKDDFL